MFILRNKNSHGGGVGKAVRERHVSQHILLCTFKTFKFRNISAAGTERLAAYHFIYLCSQRLTAHIARALSTSEIDEILHPLLW